MFNKVERHRKKIIERATPITREQWSKLNKALSDIGLPYSTFWDYGDGPVDNKVILLSSDAFVVKDYFSDNKNNSK